MQQCHRFAGIVRRGVAAGVMLGLAVASARAAGGAGGSPPAGTVALLEDHPEGLLSQLQGQDGGQGAVENGDVFSGSSSVKIIPMQRYRADVAGWAFRIRERPGPGEYRYVRFAWRADGARGIMLQFHDERDWNIRYTAGLDEPNWGSKFVAPAPPAKWALVTRDLYADFGEREIRGIALTVFGGAAGYFDHIYLGRSVEDLDRVDATIPADAPPRPSDEELERLWRDLGGDDAREAYAAFWTFIHAPGRAVPFLRQTLARPAPPGEAGAGVRQWVADLAAADYPTRQAATRRLSLRRDEAAPLLRAALLDPDVPPEVRLRVERILAPAESRAGADRLSLACRVLRYIDTKEARAVLDELAQTGAAPAASPAAAPGKP